MSEFQFAPYEMKTSLIQIYSYKDQNLQGVLQNLYYSEAKPFASSTQLLLVIEELLDEISCPRKAMEDRSFEGELDQPRRAAVTVHPKGQLLASFKINVLFRQNASWQGSLIWLDKKLEAQFRSVLELLKLLDGALNVKEVTYHEN